MKVRFHDVPRHNEDAPQSAGSRDILRQWISPRVQILPKLSELTLQSGDGIPGGGGTGGGGSTVVP